MNGLRRAPTALRCARAAVASRAAAPTSSTALSRPALLLQAQSPPPFARATLRPFSHTALLGNKKSRAKAKKAAAARDRDEDEDDEDEDDEGDDEAAAAPSGGRRRRQAARDRAAAPPPASGFDPEAAFDLADVEAEYARADERFERRAREFRAGGGRFNPELLGQLPVQPDRASPRTYPLRELASVVPRGGRAVSVIVSDAAYVKPVMSAVQASGDFNQQPQRDPDNDLELVLRIEPENPEEQAKRLKGECNAWKDAVRGVLAARKTKHAAWLKAKHLTRDDLKNLDKKVKAMQDKKIEAIEQREKQLQAELARRQKRL